MEAPSDPVPAPAPPKRSGIVLSKPVMRGIIAVGVIAALVVGRTAFRALKPPVAKVKLPPGMSKAPPPPPKPQAAKMEKAAPAQSAEDARKAIEERYALGAKALAAFDSKSFLSLKTADFQCKLPAGLSPQAPMVLSAATTASFMISSVTFQSGQLVVENVENLVQNMRKATGATRPMASAIRRRDTWVKADGAWKLKETQRLDSRTPVPLLAKGPGGAAVNASAAVLAAGEPSDDETISEKCVNEIGILCYADRDNIKKAKQCLKKYETIWLSSCRKALKPPEEAMP